MNTAFDSLTHKMQRAALGKTVDLVLSHAEKDPAKTVGQIVDLSKQFYGDSFSEDTYAHAKQTLTDPNSKWSKLINCMLNQLDPNVARTTALNLGYEAFFRGTKTIRENRVKYQCNIPWLILFDPTSACNMHCVGCWAGEYGHKNNLSFDDMDKIVTEGKELGVYLYMLTGGEPLVRKADILRLAKKHNDVQFAIYTNSTLIDEPFCKEVVRLGNIAFMLSIEGTPETNDARRGEGHYAAVMRAMDLLKEHGILNQCKLNTVKPGDTIPAGTTMSVEFVRVNHSIPDACALAIRTPAGLIVHTGDFKVDFTPISGEPIDLVRFGELGSEGVLALLSDSTNAEKPGSTPSERIVGESFEKLFERAANKRIIIATFASNVHRIQQVVDTAVRFGRKVAVFGRSMVNVVAIAQELGYLTIPAGVLIDADNLKDYTDEEIVLITTGSQGEPMSALTRMSIGSHRNIKIGPNDCIIISATPIPGNEKSVGKVVNELMKLGADVIYERMYDVHVSGHACQDETRLLLSLTQPRFFMPMHGEYKHLMKNAGVGASMGIPAEHIIISDIGKVVETDGVDMKITGMVPSGRVLVDGLGVGDVGSVVLRDRKHLAEDGMIVVCVNLSSEDGSIITGPDIITRGFIYVKESEELMDELKEVAMEAIDRCQRKRVRDWSAIKSAIKNDLSGYLYKTTKRNPMILPVIMEI